MKDDVFLPHKLSLALIVILMILVYFFMPIAQSQGIIEAGDEIYFTSDFVPNNNLSAESANILAQAHAKYVERRYQLLKDLKKADPAAFTEYAELIFWEINSVFPDNINYREKIEELEKNNPHVSHYLKKERQIWGEYKNLENKYR